MNELPGTVCIPVIKGDIEALPHEVKVFLAENIKLCSPKGIYICDGSEEEAMEITQKLVDRGMLIKLKKYDNW